MIQHAASHRAPVSDAERLAVTLRFLAAGISQQALAASYKLGTATVCVIIKEVCQALWSCLKDEVKYPQGAQWEAIRADFWTQWDYPNCIGAIDGKHVRVKAPANSGSSYYNYKGFFSFVLMAVCDANYRFTFVDIGAFGRESDAGVFGWTKFGAQLIQGRLPLPPHAPLPGTDVLTPPVFVADEAFPQKINLMRPYPGSQQLSHDQKVYNYRHSRARRVIENAFGILAARWRILGRAMECSVDTAEDVTKACVALHNFLSKRDQSLPEQTRYIPPGMIDRDGAPGEWRQVVQGDTNLISTRRITAARATRDGMTVRETFKEFFQTDQGRIDWQDRHVRRGTVNNVA
ncbi:Protein ALP1-like [Merluccius polli]|uniref:Protein ALP1-like n=1 Tax=Merluccius polli TaxID=89951 RepID=A0AA47N5Y2_MERPO|nr:Protein ALP1-like [Merluccius polli]